MAQTRSHPYEQFGTFKSLRRKKSIWFGSNKLQYQAFKCMTRILRHQNLDET